MCCRLGRGPSTLAWIDLGGGGRVLRLGHARGSSAAARTGQGAKCCSHDCVNSWNIILHIICTTLHLLNIICYTLHLFYTKMVLLYETFCGGNVL